MIIFTVAEQEGTPDDASDKNTGATTVSQKGFHI
jgi:hypothetical protein